MPVREQDQYMLAFNTVPELITFTRLPQDFKKIQVQYFRKN